MNAFSVIGIVLVILKILGVIGLSWWLVTIHSWLGLAIWLAMMLFAVTAVSAFSWFKR